MSRLCSSNCKFDLDIIYPKECKPFIHCRLSEGIASQLGNGYISHHKMYRYIKNAFVNVRVYVHVHVPSTCTWCVQLCTQLYFPVCQMFTDYLINFFIFLGRKITVLTLDQYSCNARAIIAGLQKEKVITVKKSWCSGTNEDESGIAKWVEMI